MTQLLTPTPSELSFSDECISGNRSKNASPFRCSPAFTSVCGVAWDFDCTITRIHTSNLTLEQLAEMSLDDIVADIDFFKNTVEHLDNLGVVQCIASYGCKNIIIHVLNRIFGNSCPIFIDNIITPATISKIHSIDWRDGHHPPHGYGKWSIMDYFINKNKLKRESVVLIDDSFENCCSAKAKGYRAKCLKYYSKISLSSHDSNLTPDNIEIFWEQFSKML